MFGSCSAGIVHQQLVMLLTFCPVQDRIAAAGGRVFFNGGLRVMGMLATTRAIGDHDLRPYGVVPTPDVVKYERTGQEEYLVLASDGLWDVMSNEVSTGGTFLQLLHLPDVTWHSGFCCVSIAVTADGHWLSAHQ